ncbi:MAG: aminopeptidase, partial [Sphingomonadales bacterium]|nr:aminopeptidase [Sphingomonadales bacterium]
MSFYPNEGMPLWDKYSTEAIVHTLETYSKYTFDYPYPTSQSVLGPISGGMEYPMITSNGPRTEKGKDGKRTYTRRAKYGLISVVIHEVGHNWFPMIVDTDERNWTWMDEGLNSFLQTLSEREWERNYPGRRIEPRYISNYMTSENQVPIMTQSESILQFGNNAYAKPAAALNILRESVMGRELFDFAFKTYSNRWKFKRPYPADFFRSMEDAGGVDLDWFWRGWFYSTDHVEMSIDRVVKASVGKQTPDEEANWKRDRKDEREKWTGLVPTDGINYRTDRFPELLDFYNENDEFTVTDGDRKKYEGWLKGLKDWEREVLKHKGNIYFVDLSNNGGLVMPVILRVEYADRSVETLRIPAEIWRRNPKKVTKAILSDKEITAITLDPYGETADAVEHNNYWPRKAMPSRLEMMKRKVKPSLMRRVLDDEKKAEEDAKNEDKKNK